jgi:hypothetical protein
MCRPGRFIMYTDNLNALAKGGIYPTFQPVKKMTNKPLLFFLISALFFFFISKREQVEQVILFRWNEDARKWRRRRFLNHHFSTRPGKCIYCLPTVTLLLLISWIFFCSFSFRDPPSRRARTPFHLRVILYLGPRQVSSRPRLRKKKKKKKEIYPHKSSIAFSVWRGGQPKNKEEKKKKKKLIFNLKGKRKKRGGKSAALLSLDTREYT